MIENKSTGSYLWAQKVRIEVKMTKIYTIKVSLQNLYFIEIYNEFSIILPQTPDPKYLNWL